MSQEPIQVAVFDPQRRPQPRHEPPARRPLTDRLALPHRNALGSMACAAAAVALHALIIAPLLPPPGHLHRPPTIPDEMTAEAQEPALQVVFIQEAGPHRRAEPPDTASPALSLVTPDLSRSFALPPDLSPPDPDVPSPSHPDAAGNALLAGRYLGQIDARISRAWLRPRTPIGAPFFNCRVQVEQDRAGNVQEIMLEHCNGDARWQHSLVSAIQAASPLPAPPDPAVFRSTLHLGFTAAAYAPGSPAGDYGPPPADAVAAVQPPDSNSPVQPDD